MTSFVRSIALGAVFAVSLPFSSIAESSLELPLQAPFGALPAATYDENTMNRVGDAKVSLTRLPNGNLLMVAAGAIDGAEASVVMSELERTKDGAGLRPVWQESHSWAAGGQSHGMMWIDHRAGRALCTPAEGSDETPFELALQNPDLIANVPMHLLFLPLISGAKEEVSFDFLVCKIRRVVSAKARVARHLASSSAGDLIEVRSEIDLGPVLTPLARAFLPRFSFWFDTGEPERWVGHRMPLGTGGPQVLIVRAGIPVRELEASQ
ncbi:MAG TPA: hypothetical protein DEP35_14340 [Deltaproteobacteria bacterium]|nr:hypothetical protein [Deltaproteobacteria bacterium]